MGVTKKFGGVPARRGGGGRGDLSTDDEFSPILRGRLGKLRIFFPLREGHTLVTIVLVVALTSRSRRCWDSIRGGRRGSSRFPSGSGVSGRRSCVGWTCVGWVGGSSDSTLKSEGLGGGGKSKHVRGEREKGQCPVNFFLAPFYEYGVNRGKIDRTYLENLPRLLMYHPQTFQPQEKPTSVSPRSRKHAHTYTHTQSRREKRKSPSRKRKRDEFSPLP